MLTLSHPSPSKVGQGRRSCGRTGWFMPTSQHRASNHNFTRWTTRHLTMSKPSFAMRTHASSSPHPTSTAPIWQNGKICTWKNHFLSGIAGLPKTFPIANWCHLTNQTDFTLNMLWPCCQNPALLAFKALKGSYSFDATPTAPLGTKVLAHHKPTFLFMA